MKIEIPSLEKIKGIVKTETTKQLGIIYTELHRLKSVQMRQDDEFRLIDSKLYELKKELKKHG